MKDIEDVKDKLSEDYKHRDLDRRYGIDRLIESERTMDVMKAIYNKEENSASKISENRDIDRSYVSEIIGSLEACGAVIMLERDRSKKWGITEKGENFLDLKEEIYHKKSKAEIILREGIEK
jgi:DNA-binding MarR family transcriptional regulator